MITFAPGPSKVYDALPHYMQDAFNQGILSANHRSGAFMQLYQETEQLMREKLHMPDDYKLLFTSSATENWEIISQSIVERASFHIYSGSFGKKWFEYAKHIVPASSALKLEANQAVDIAGLEISEEFDVIAITQNETANASQVPMSVIEAIGGKFPEKMIAVDTTSSMGGIEMDFSLADIWYASVQKCFGLPAGLGVLIVSPKAIEKALQKGEKGRYNSLNFMLENAAGFQTHYTPNVFGIYLLNRVLEDLPEIQHVDARLRARMKNLENTIAQSEKFRMLVDNELTRSTTVMGVAGSEELISAVKKAAEKEGMQLGSGYGPLKPTSFRIANFPAITDAEFNRLITFLKNY
ncbi:MAG: aminotransferase class V-fold PLP-dependent enzyme [Algoriphagus sp.]|uniref:aminotransferase class V-fold PLP-dependent enzyme n=1 Tax=Algoriphagus sp. TaxID=1872435 RepID=UPI00272FC5AB|nr:aminotransferase class V-fold PLP-dependent enzyme [Algoriphagus sp.]MDP2041055.1 aminotransferase class V-fold PLP-dependent enzyme [Algoriphagus sp.]MDP3470392.1 aminotransferase class V-fold PLP-dependent enzyme [Algoriphagus sp.]